MTYDEMRRELDAEHARHHEQRARAGALTEENARLREEVALHQQKALQYMGEALIAEERVRELEEKHDGCGDLLARHDAAQAELARLRETLANLHANYEALAGDYAGADADRQGLAAELARLRASIARMADNWEGKNAHGMSTTGHVPSMLRSLLTPPASPAVDCERDMFGRVVPSYACPASPAVEAPAEVPLTESVDEHYARMHGTTAAVEAPGPASQVTEAEWQAACNPGWVTTYLDQVNEQLAKRRIDPTEHHAVAAVYVQQIRNLEGKRKRLESKAALAETRLSDLADDVCGLQPAGTSDDAVRAIGAAVLRLRQRVARLEAAVRALCAGGSGDLADWNRRDIALGLLAELRSTP